MIQQNVDLSRMTTFHIGGIAENLFIPESYDELLKIIKSIGDDDYYIISAGSNLLINDEKRFKNVISMKSFDKNIIQKSDGVFYVGASVNIQSLIKETNRLGYGGLEQFYSIPALIGGMIYMNAGVGKKKNNSIGDYIISVELLNKNGKHVFSHDDCQFKYRESIFQKISKSIILGATLKLEKIDLEEASLRIKERLNYVKITQDHSGFNFGTLFCEADSRIIALTRFFSKGKPDGIHFSYKNPNCLINSGNGSYSEAVKLIKKVQTIHKIFHKRCQLEVRIWD